MDYRDNRQRWAESHQVVHFYAGQWCTFTPALTVPSEYTEEEVKAVLALRTTSVCAPGEIVDWAKGKLPRYALPRYVEFVDELPHTDTGKVQKTSLRERWKTTATFDIEKNFYLEE